MTVDCRAPGAPPETPVSFHCPHFHQFALSEAQDQFRSVRSRRVNRVRSTANVLCVAVLR